MFSLTAYRKSVFVIVPEYEVSFERFSQTLNVKYYAIRYVYVSKGIIIYS